MVRYWFDFFIGKINILIRIGGKELNFCKKCGATLEDNQQFCSSCGTKVVSDEIIKAANEKGISMINEHEITQQAIENGRQIVDKANMDAAAVRESAYTYADNLLETVEKVCVSSMKELEQCISIVRSNRSELRANNGAPIPIPEENYEEE